VKPKHRKDGVKREHGIAPGVLPILERIAKHALVNAVIPGRIRVTSSNTPGLIVRLQARTVTGFKLGARSASLAQEVFVVTRDPDQVEADLVAAGLIESR
jgi:hypothetical protein